MTRVAVTPEAVRAAVREVLAGLNVLPSLAGEPDDDTHARIARHQSRREAVARLARHLEGTLGARIADRQEFARVQLHGITATSTGGIAAALRNWIGAADRWLARMEREGNGHGA